MKTLRLAWRMLARDWRAGELHLLGLAIVIAVASMTSVGFLTDRVARGLDREANQLLGGDLLLLSDRPWGPAVYQQARDQGLQVTDTVLFNSMVGSEETVELAGVKAVASGYPLRGSVRIAPAPNQPDAVASDIPAPGEIWLDERLYAALGVRTGDTVELGLKTLRVAAMVSFESDRGTNFFSLLPRAIFNQADLADAGLLIEGSRATWRLHVAGTLAQVEAFQKWVEPQLQRGQAVETVENARPEIRSALDQAQRFLRLAALLAVILAAVAVGLSARRFMQRHLNGCAVMRCLGARQAQIAQIFIGEFILFGLVTALLGGAIGWGVQHGLVGYLVAVMQTELPLPSLAPFAHGVAVGMVLLVGFVLPQLLQLAQVPTVRVLRRELGAVAGMSRLSWALGALALTGLIVWIAADLRLALWVAGGFAVAMLLFALAAWAVLRGLQRLLRNRGASAGSFGGWRYGLTALNRRLAASVVQASALGLGMAALLLLVLVRGDLLQDWRRMASEDAPNRFIINIQPDQREGIAAHFRAHGYAAPSIMPMIRGRLMAINGEPVHPDHYTDRRAQRLAEREFNLSYAAQLPDTNQVSAGRWHGDSREPQFSIEAGLAETFQLKLGDQVRFNISGREVEAPITSVRSLDWDSMRVNFFFIAAPGMLENDPASLITSFHLPAGDHAFITSLVRAFPNLTVIDVAALLEQIREMTDKLILIVQFVFGFAVLAGLVVLYASLQATHDEREFELAVLRTLGGRNDQLRRALLAEFAVLGGVAGVLAGVGSSAIAWALAEFVFKMAYVPSVLPVIAAVLAGGLSVVVGGWFGTRALLARPPLASLRALAA